MSGHWLKKTLKEDAHLLIEWGLAITFVIVELLRNLKDNDALWLLKWILFAAILCYVAYRVYVRVRAKLASDREVMSQLNAAWANCVGRVRSILEAAKDKVSRDGWLAADLSKPIRETHGRLSALLEAKPSFWVRQSILRKLRIIEPAHDLLANLLINNGAHFNEFLREYIKNNAKESLVEFDRTRRVKAEESKVGKIFEGMKAQFDEIQNSCDAAINAQLKDEDARRLHDRVQQSIWISRWEIAGHKHTFDAGFGIVERYRYETFGQNTPDGGSNWVSGIEIEMKTLFLKVTEPLFRDIV